MAARQVPSNGLRAKLNSEDARTGIGCHPRGLQLVPKQPRVPVGGHFFLGDSTPNLLLWHIDTGLPIEFQERGAAT